ncbi:MAG TPA: hypothetical protein VII90_10560 [Anaerolineales bacterium]
MPASTHFEAGMNSEQGGIPAELAVEDISSSKASSMNLEKRRISSVWRNSGVVMALKNRQN